MPSSVRAYRAGYRPEERRAIEQGLVQERLLGVVSTSALELGIDIGGLDACLLVGYPGSIASTWQRGGRVGRAGQEALIILVALPDALDQYFMRHPEDFFVRRPEAAVIDPGNRRILRDHLVAAAAELPLRPADAAIYGEELARRIRELDAEHRLVQSADGTEWYARRRNPAREISIRSVGESFAILNPAGKTIGSVDGFRAIHECHPGAIYLHQGQQFEVTGLDLAQRKVQARPVDVDYYTQTSGEKETEILQCQEVREVKRTVARLGRLKVTERITGYEKRRIFGQDRIGSYPLDLPPHTFETQGLWFEVPEAIRDYVKQAPPGGLHFMGGIHAIEHAAISLFPLFALCDRGDVGGISHTFHPQVGRPAIFIYDGYPEGIGLAERCYRVLDDLLADTLALLRDCPCETGCPSCIHSPKCGSGNKPLDKAAAILTLEGLLGLIEVPAAIQTTSVGMLPAAAGLGPAGGAAGTRLAPRGAPRPGAGRRNAAERRRGRRLGPRRSDGAGGGRDPGPCHRRGAGLSRGPGRGAPGRARRRGAHHRLQRAPIRLLRPARLPRAGLRGAAHAGLAGRNPRHPRLSSEPEPSGPGDAGGAEIWPTACRAWRGGKRGSGTRSSSTARPMWT